MSYQAVIAKAVAANIPVSALLELTYLCNLDCFYCYNDRRPSGRLLSLTQYGDLFEGLRDLGTLYLAFSGGEPLLHSQFFDLGARARALGFAIRVKSNGHPLNGRMARRLRDEVDPFAIEISLHGASAASHERQTRVPGSFARLLENLDALSSLGLRVQLNATLTAWNQGEMDDMLALAERLGLPLRWSTEVTARDNGDLAPLDIAASSAAVGRLRLRLAQKKGGESAATESSSGWCKYCSAGSSGLAVDPWGTVYPCVEWRVAAGNLHHDGIRDIWEHSPVLEKVRGRTEVLALTIPPTADEDRPLFCPGIHEIAPKRSASRFTE